MLVVGAGHNGLVAAALLARAGLRVKVVEACGTLGGAVRTEAPFPRAPALRTSTGAYLLGLMPPELALELGLLSVEATAERYVRPTLQRVFVDLCRRPIRDYLARFGFESELIQAMYAVTDGFSGLSAPRDMPGTRLLAS